MTWQFICYADPFDETETIDPLDPVNPDDAEMIAFITDDDAVVAFLRELLAKYRSSSEVWPGWAL